MNKQYDVRKRVERCIKDFQSGGKSNAYNTFLKRVGLDEEQVSGVYKVICDELSDIEPLAKDIYAEGKLQMDINKQFQLLRDVFQEVGLLEQIPWNVVERIRYPGGCTNYDYPEAFKKLCALKLSQKGETFKSFVGIGVFEGDYTANLIIGFHESGHAIHNLGFPKDAQPFMNMSLPDKTCAGIAGESIARLFENIPAKSIVFWTWLQDKFGEKYPELLRAKPREIVSYLFNGREHEEWRIERSFWKRRTERIDIKRGLLNGEMSLDQSLHAMRETFEFKDKRVFDHEIFLGLEKLFNWNKNQEELDILFPAVAIQSACGLKDIIHYAENGNFRPLVRCIQETISPFADRVDYQTVLEKTTHAPLNPKYLRQHFKSQKALIQMISLTPFSEKKSHLCHFKSKGNPQNGFKIINYLKRS